MRRTDGKYLPMNQTVTPRRLQRSRVDEFIAWYCSEPRLALNRIVVLRYLQFSEAGTLAPATINPRLAAIRRLAYEAADGGLLSPDLAAGIRRVKGVKHLGFRVGNWLTTAEGQQLLQSIPRDTIRGKSDGLRITSRRSCSAEHSAGSPLATLASCGHKKSTTLP
jgi:hypothetical protein